MNARTQNVIGRIFIQSIAALALITGALGIAEASHDNSLEQLFETKAQADYKRYHASVNDPFSDAEKRLAQQAIEMTYRFDYDNAHQFSEIAKVDARDKAAAWPLMRVRVQDGNVNVKMGSRYSE